MTEYSATERSHGATESGSLSVPFLVLSAVLVGAGLFGMAYWLVTFQWPFFASVVPLALGAYMLFTRGTGPDRA